MVRSYSYAIVRLAPNPIRDERLNVGIVVLGEDWIEPRAPKNLGKLAAISAGLDTDLVRSSLEQLRDIDSFARESGCSDAKSRLSFLAQMTPFAFSEPALLHAPSSAAFEHELGKLMKLCVEPEPGAAKDKPKRSSPLLATVKQSLKQERVLARKGEDLSAHRVVSGLALAEGLSADLVLQNGAMHVIETVDATGDAPSLRKVISEIAVSALVLEQARIIFGQEKTKPQLIYQASASVEAAAQPSLNAVEHQGAQLINWASRDDRVKFLTCISALAVPFEDTKRSSYVGPAHASTQHRFSLN